MALDRDAAGETLDELEAVLALLEDGYDETAAADASHFAGELAEAFDDPPPAVTDLRTGVERLVDDYDEAGVERTLEHAAAVRALVDGDVE